MDGSEVTVRVDPCSLRRLACLLAAVLACAALPAAAAPPPAPADVSSPPRVVGVELRVPETEDRVALAAFVDVRPGEALSTRALRRTVQRLYQTGRFRDVVIRATPAAPPPNQHGEWVSLVIEALPVRMLATLEVRIEGPAVLDAAGVRAAARLPTGEPFDASDLDAAAARVRTLLARRGYPEAAVEASALRDDAALLRVAAGEPVRIRSVRLSGSGEAPRLTSALRSRAGAVLDRDVLEADVRAARASLYEGGYRRARVGTPVVRVEGRLADVELPVDAGPRLAFVFRGNQEIASQVLARQLAFEDGQPVDAPAIAAAADRIRAFYRQRGFAGARVEPEETRHGRLAAVVFHVEEGRRYRLREVRLDGVEQRDAATLRAQLAAILDEEGGKRDETEADRGRALLVSIPGVRPPRAPPAALAPSEVWDEASWARAAERIVDDYRADGWLEAVYLGASVSLDARERVADVTVRLREGPRTHVEAISFEGNRIVSLAELARESRLAPGDPLVFERIEETRAAILRRYLARGHLYARLDAREELDPERHTVAIRFVVDEGPQVRIGRVLLSGNRRTRDDVVRGALAFAEGDVYDPERIAKSQAALLRLGVFRSVSIRVQEPEAPHATKDLAVELAERPWATLSQGVGFSIADGPRAFVEYGEPNILGRALELGARAKVNYPLETPWVERPDLAGKAPSDRVEGRAEVGLRTPTLAFLPIPASVRTNVIGEMLHRKAYALRRASAIAGVDAGLTSRLSASLQYEIEVDRIDRTNAVGYLTQADLERLRFDEGITTLHALRPSISIDDRDNSAHPHSGWAASGALEYARSLGAEREGPDDRALFGLLPASGIHTNMLKLSASSSGYLPVGRGSVVALSLRGGRVFPLDRRSQTIIPRRFFLGGASSMRGYGEEEMIPEDVRSDLSAEARHCATSPTKVGCTDRGSRIAAGDRPVSEGGEAFLLAKTELRIPLRRSLEAGLFFDLGNLWLDPMRYRLVDLRANAGVGLRFVTPIGPAALDLGFNLDPDRAVNERIFAPHFTIGLF
ncbi:POTRA domain-containing protein [Anaeromyxobacter soli]|uniref:POTRA domain-containing protein n=1 Tax=Anaeromyxobacter soli TaxID=2922725 RepID=UPI001FAECEA4|nr:POTRA domain-containing protein [Anaeromyxobacter sp. SG29]